MITTVIKKEILQKAVVRIEFETAEEIQAFKNLLGSAEFAIRQRRMGFTSINKIEDTILKDLQNQL